MPRRCRCVLPGLPCHVTQRGVDHCQTFTSDHDRLTYLRLLHDNLQDAQVSLLGWCLMSNHVHLIAIPEREDSLAVLLRRVHGRYAQYFNAHTGRTGHLWQNRYFACILGESHLWAALAYVDRNPVRAGAVKQPAEYLWSSAAAHLSGVDNSGLIDCNWWREQPGAQNWQDALTAEEPPSTALLRRCTFSGRPFAADDVVQLLSLRFGRKWTRGRPPIAKAVASVASVADQSLRLSA